MMEITQKKVQFQVSFMAFAYKNNCTAPGGHLTIADTSHVHDWDDMQGTVRFPLTYIQLPQLIGG
jgi:hypothetical protein